MSNQSNNQGRAYEYACINTLNNEINKFRKSEIIENSAYFVDKNAWQLVDDNIKKFFIISSQAVVETIFDLEPLILENDKDILSLKIQTDNEGKEGDVRDIVISRSNIEWEIGLSVKHNNFAVKHSRLASSLDFGKKWFGVSCSNDYWNDICPVFDYLKEQKYRGKNWRDLDSKEDVIYVPLLNAFMKEINRSNKINSSVPKRMVEYLLGEFDFYKIISIDSKKLTKVQSYNLHGSLNKSTQTKQAAIKIPIVNLPTRIVNFEFKPNSKNTVELYMNNGWQFSFRIHNASTRVEPSLKFDVQIIGMPTTIISIDCLWKKEK